jgi:hypothetical protein
MQNLKGFDDGNTLKNWVYGHCPSSKVLNNQINVVETGCFHLQVREKGIPTLLGLSERVNLNYRTTEVKSS